ncbi:uncharacterized protein LOC126663365 [Mercurialis annua]|uniref:uncharacterized protein LOC126663365 n=1 Tax=Mercurialis annua TaxID=3986 RepID=UPI00216062A9|nr:uncharacterized protein LOC126663365 [Mercurialis annua]XP_050212376.1 uncharacterized protein LOC126663365 [Mercurialis annua]XP_050212377.1 uncharacterized protein LOC126663365 [Mercurialis annua]XP_050212378.1 uncharacterized protein LOC126663365 [Mercurialis annua]
MAKVSKAKCKAESTRCRLTRYPLSSCQKKSAKDCRPKIKHSKVLEKNDWERSNCSVCLEYPHNAVLLLCSSYNKGCRPYMCETSCRFSNCLEQYKKAYTKVTSNEGMSNSTVGNSNFVSGARLANEKIEVPEILCPLCRGLVKGWTVVEAARKYFNTKRRTCMQDKCSFVGTYRQLKKHVKAKHPLARPRAVDPMLKAKWKKLECERERSDVISTIMSSTPGAVVLGDYVIEPGRNGIFNDHDDYDSDESLGDDFFPLESLNRGHRSGHFRNGFHSDFFDSLGVDDYDLHRPRLLMARGRGRLRGNYSSRNPN